ncbi:MAG: nuclear transport factor 2 family protein [Alcaligenaceae bacterium]|nr:nuclear transport factor 2 family protein [Alcaligenaceae bacterium]
MSNQMDIKRATEFGQAWNSGDAALVASYFTEDGSYHASVGQDRLGKSFRGRGEVQKGVQRFFEVFPGGRFENLKVNLFGSFGTFEWDFVVTDAHGNKISTAGCDLLEFEGNMVKDKNAFRKARPEKAA